MTLFVLKVNDRPRTFRHLLDALSAVTVLRFTLPTARLTLKRVVLPEIGTR